MSIIFIALAQCILALFVPFIYAVLMVLPIVVDRVNGRHVAGWFYALCIAMFCVPGVAFIHSLFAGWMLTRVLILRTMGRETSGGTSLILRTKAIVHHSHPSPRRCEHRDVTTPVDPTPWIETIS